MARRRRRISNQPQTEVKPREGSKKLAPKKLPPNVQGKVKLGPANDHFEKEADTVADKVVSMPSGAKPVAQNAEAGVQRSVSDGITPVAQRQATDKEPAAKREVQRSEEKEPAAKREVQKMEEKEPAAKREVQMMEEKEPAAKREVQRSEEKEPAAKREVQRSEEKEPAAKREVQMMEEKEPAAKREVQMMEEKEPAAKREVQRSEEKEPAAKREVQMMEEKEPAAKREVQRSEEKEPAAKREVQMMEEKEPAAKREVQKMEEKEPQAKNDTATESANMDVSAAIDRERAGGKKMDESTRAFMEQRFGADFDEVRIHDDPEAARISKELGAQAFAIGEDVFFNTGKYNPDTNEGKRLLAHELTHTIQQSGKKGKKGKEAKTSKAEAKPKDSAKIKESGADNTVQKKEVETGEYLFSPVELEIRKEYDCNSVGIYQADSVPDGLGFALPAKYQVFAHKGETYYYNPKSKKLVLYKPNPTKKEKEPDKEDDGFPDDLSKIPLTGTEYKVQEGVVIDGKEGNAVIYTDGSIELFDSGGSLIATYVPSPVNLLGMIPGVPKDFNRYMAYGPGGKKKGMTGFNPDAIFSN